MWDEKKTQRWTKEKRNTIAKEGGKGERKIRNIAKEDGRRACMPLSVLCICVWCFFSFSVLTSPDCHWPTGGCLLSIIVPTTHVSLALFTYRYRETTHHRLESSFSFRHVNANRRWCVCFWRVIYRIRLRRWRIFLFLFRVVCLFHAPLLSFAFSAVVFFIAATFFFASLPLYRTTERKRLRSPSRPLQPDGLWGEEGGGRRDIGGGGSGAGGCSCSSSCCC